MTTTTITAVATGDGRPVHPAAQAVMDALATLKTYQPTSPQDAALLLRSLGGDGIGEHQWGASVVNEAFDVMLGLVDRVLDTFPGAWGAVVYADDALNTSWDKARGLLMDSREAWLDDTDGEMAVCQAAAILERPHVAENRASAADSGECILCGAPGGYSYCSDACRAADECRCTGDTCTC